MAAPAQKPKMPSHQAPRPNPKPTPAEAKRRPGGCFAIAAQKSRIAKGKARAKSGKPSGGRPPSAMGAVKKLSLDVMQITIGMGVFMSSLIGSLLNIGRGYVPVIETGFHRANAEAYQRVAGRTGAVEATPQGFAASYAVETSGGAGGVAHKREVTAPAPVPAPRPDDSAELKRIRDRAQERYGNARTYSAMADYFASVLADPDKAKGRVRQELAAGSFSEELKAFLMHPNRSDVKTLNNIIQAVAKAEHCSREMAVAIVMEDVEEAARHSAYEQRQKAEREKLALADDEGGAATPPAGPAGRGM